MAEPCVVEPFSVTVESGPNAARAVLAEVLNNLSALELSSEECGTVELVLAEVLNNVVEHAYPESDAPGPIYLRCAVAGDGLHFETEDHGRPMPNEQLPTGAAADLDMDVMDLPEGGFGWFLIRDLAEDVEYQRHDGCNRLRLRVIVSKGDETS